MIQIKQSKQDFSVNTNDDALVVCEKLRYRMAELDINAVELGRVSGVKASFIYDILNGKSENPSIVKLAKVAEVLGVNVSYFVGGQEARSLPLRSSLSFDKNLSLTFIFAKEIELGRYEIYEKAEDFIAFEHAWLLDKFGVEGNKLKLIRVLGDSMEPSLCHNDVVIIDTSRKHPSPPGIFAIFDGMGIITKRLEPLSAGVVRVSSDNSQYKAYEEKLANLNILGRIVWFSREV